MNWKTILNPFSKYSENQLFIFGIIASSVILTICFYLGYQANSIFHYTTAKSGDSLLMSLGKSMGVYLISIIILFVLGKLFNKRTRLIDIVNTVLISQIPGFIIILLAEMPLINNSLSTIQKIAETAPDAVPISEVMIVCIFSFLVLLFLAYGFALIYNGFRTATNMKSLKQIIIFAFVVLATSIICQFLI